MRGCLPPKPSENCNSRPNTFSSLIPGKHDQVSLVRLASLILKLGFIWNTADYMRRQVSLLMNNAAIGPVGKSWEGLDNWHKIFSINVMGAVNVQQTFVPVRN